MIGLGGRVCCSSQLGNVNGELYLLFVDTPRLTDLKCPIMGTLDNRLAVFRIQSPRLCWFHVISPITVHSRMPNLSQFVLSSTIVILMYVLYKNVDLTQTEYGSSLFTSSAFITLL